MAISINRNLLFALLLVVSVVGRGQSTISSGDRYEGRKIIYQTTLSEPRSYDNFEVPSPDRRYLRLVVTGPDVFIREKNHELYLFIIPLSTDQEIISRNVNIVKSFDLSIQVPEASAVFGPQPIVYAKFTGENQFTRMEDMDPFWKNFYAAIGSSLEFAFGFIPIVGQIYSFSKAAGKTYKWEKIEATDWVRNWKTTSEYDIYPLINPVATKEQGFIEQYKVVLPFSMNELSSGIELNVNRIVISNISAYSDGNYSLFHLDKPAVLKPSQVKSSSPVINLLPAGILASETMGIRLVSTNEQLTIDIKAELVKSGTKNKLAVSLKPVFSSGNKVCQTYSMILETPKRAIQIPAFPSVTDQKGTPLHIITEKEIAGKEALKEWMLFGIGAYAGITNEFAIKALDKGLNGIEYLSNLSDDLNQKPFSAIQKEYWIHESSFNTYQFPPFRESVHERGFDFHLPVESLKTTIQATLYIMMEPAGVFMSIPLTMKPEPDNEGFTLGFILDSSGSMEQSDPKNIRKSAVNQIIDLIDPANHLFIVDFDDKATWLNQDKYQHWDRTEIKRLVETINSSGGTNIGNGIDKMQEILVAHEKKTAKSAVVLFTDGKGEYHNNATWFTQNGIPIYTISYKDQADALLLQKIAIQTKGHFIQANNEIDVVNAVMNFLSSIFTNNIICSYTSTINLQQNINYDFYVDPGSTQLSTSLSWLGSNIAMALTAPDQTKYPVGSSANWITGANYSICRLNDPLPGKWQARLTGVEIPGNGEPFTFMVTSDSPARFELKTNMTDDGSVQLALEDKTSLADLSILKPIITVETPIHQMIDISSSFRSGQLFYYPVDGPGNYRFSLSFDLPLPRNQHIQRHFSASVFVGKDAPSFSGKIIGVLGNHLTAAIGKKSANKPGFTCKIYHDGSSLTDPVAIGYVTNVMNDFCEIEIQRFLGANYKITEGDIVLLDVIQWKSDSP